MRVKHGLWLLVLAAYCCLATDAISQDFAPAGNLVGITNVHEKITVALNLKGADEFRMDSQKITALVRDTLSAAGVGTNGSGIGTPMGSPAISVQVKVRFVARRLRGQRHKAEPD